MPSGEAVQLANATVSAVIDRYTELTGRPCLYYIAIVEQHVSTGRSSYWKQIIKEEMGVAFQVVKTKKALRKLKKASTCDLRYFTERS